MKPSEVLDNAANIILRDGWIQGKYYREVTWHDGESLAVAKAEDLAANKSAPCCQAGAICRSVYGYAWIPSGVDTTLAQEIARIKAGDFMDDYVRRVHGAGSTLVWNDASTTTKGMVVAALRGAAEDARAAGE